MAKHDHNQLSKDKESQQGGMNLYWNSEVAKVSILFLPQDRPFQQLKKKKKSRRHSHRELWIFYKTASIFFIAHFQFLTLHIIHFPRKTV